MKRAQRNFADIDTYAANLTRKLRADAVITHEERELLCDLLCDWADNAAWSRWLAKQQQPKRYLPEPVPSQQPTTGDGVRDLTPVPK